MNIFSEKCYRTILKGRLEQLKQFDKSKNYKYLADTTRIPKSYISKVMHGHANFHDEQLYSIAVAMDFNEEELEYLQLLLTYERSTNTKYKDYLAEKVKGLQTKHLDTNRPIQSHSNDLNEAIVKQYFLDPLLQVVHTALSLDKVKENPNRLNSALGIDPETLADALGKLEELGLLERDGTHIKLHHPNLHLPKTNPIYKAWRNQFKLMAAGRMTQISQQRSNAFMAIFTGSEEERQKIMEEINNLISRCEKLCTEASKDQVYYLAIDLFPWLDPQIN